MISTITVKFDDDSTAVIEPGDKDEYPSITPEEGAVFLPHELEFILNVANRANEFNDVND